MITRTSSNKNVERYFNEIKKIKPLSKEDEMKIGLKIKNGDKKAINDLIYYNLKFVISVSKNYEGCGVDFDELIAAGNVGLIDAAKRFDYEKNFKFISFALWHIRNKIINVIQSTNSKYPIGGKRANFIGSTIFSECSKFEQKNHRPPTVEELSIETGLSAQMVNDMMKLFESPIYLDSSLKNGKDTYHDVCNIENCFDTNCSIKNFEGKDFIDKTMEILSKKEKYVIENYYGLNDEGIKKNFNEISIDLSLCRERIRQIHDRAIKKLRSNMNFIEKTNKRLA